MVLATLKQQTVVSMRRYPNLSGSENLLGILAELGVITATALFLRICSHIDLEPRLPVNTLWCYLKKGNKHMNF